MEIEVKQVTKTDKEVKEGIVTIYKVKLDGSNKISGYNNLKATITLESESPDALKQWVEMDIGSKRDLRMGYLNHSLEDFEEEYQEAKLFKAEIQNFDIHPTKHDDEDAHAARLAAAEAAGTVPK